MDAPAPDASAAAPPFLPDRRRRRWRWLLALLALALVLWLMLPGLALALLRSRLPLPLGDAARLTAVGDGSGMPAADAELSLSPDRLRSVLIGSGAVPFVPPGLLSPGLHAAIAAEIPGAPRPFQLRVVLATREPPSLRSRGDISLFAGLGATPQPLVPGFKISFAIAALHLRDAEAGTSASTAGFAADAPAGSTSILRQFVFAARGQAVLHPDTGGASQAIAVRALRGSIALRLTQSHDGLRCEAAPVLTVLDADVLPLAQVLGIAPELLPVMLQGTAMTALASALRDLRLPAFLPTDVTLDLLLGDLEPGALAPSPAPRIVPPGGRAF